MARELNRTLVMWPVFTSPHYDLDGSGPDARGPLFFDEYVRIGGDGVTDSPNRLVSYRDPSLPRRVRDFPLSHPNSCVTSNGERVDVQFPVSADLSRAVVAKAGTASSYEEQVRALRRMGDSPDGHEIETLCVASTFGNADYNKARHGETALAWKSLDFRPVGRFHHWWANAVDNMVLAFGPKREAGIGIDDGRVPSAGRSTKRLAPRALDRALDGAATAAGAGGGAARAAAIEKRSSDASSSANPGRIGDAAADDRDGSSSSVFSRTEPSFRVTSKYTALHWRRGDKCGRKSKRQASRNAGPVGHSFDAHGSARVAGVALRRSLLPARACFGPLRAFDADVRRDGRPGRGVSGARQTQRLFVALGSRRVPAGGFERRERRRSLGRRVCYDDARTGKDPGRAGGRRRARAGRDARRGRRGELHVRAHRAGAAVRPHAHVTRRAAVDQRRRRRRGVSTSERRRVRGRGRLRRPPPPRWASAKAISSRGDFFLFRASSRVRRARRQGLGWMYRK